MKTILKYDSSFEGLLSSVFYVYEHKLKEVSIIKEEHYEPNFFDHSLTILSEPKKAKRVWQGLSKKISLKAKTKLYKAFLSETLNIENTILYYIRKALSASVSIENDFTDSEILHLEKTVKKVDREKHRMDAFVRFQLTKDGIYFATIEPDFDVLPLNTSHFKSRYADQRWLIYDIKRNYGIFYDLLNVQTITLELSTDIYRGDKASLYFTYEEIEFQKLWFNYFNSSNIGSRKNIKLHIKHIPKRYWKFLTEKKI